MRELTAFASRTGTRRNLDLLRAFGWKLLVSATGCLRHEGFPYALDNGAWTAHQQNKPFDERRFIKALNRMGSRAEWVVLPDIVGAGMRSFEFSVSWLDYVRSEAGTVLLAVQQGVDPSCVRDVLRPSVGVFVGGDTVFKEGTMAFWCDMARSKGAYSHVGRVNTARRIRLCGLAGADSFDGTSATKFAATIEPLSKARDATRGLYAHHQQDV